MYVTVRINEELPTGTFVCHDNNNVWRKATSSDVAPLGVTRGESFLDESNTRWSEVTLSGTCFARASSNIPDSGGWLGCSDEGRAVVIPQEDSGLVAPLSRDMQSPQEDDLILIFLR